MVVGINKQPATKDDLNSQVDKIGKVRIVLTANTGEARDGLCWVSKRPGFTDIAKYIVTIQQLMVSDDSKEAIWQDVEIVMTNEGDVRPENNHG